MEIITEQEIEAAAIAFYEATEMTEESKIDFCTAWPVAKQVLEFLTAIPGYGWVVKMVIALGDAYFGRKCPN